MSDLAEDFDPDARRLCPDGACTGLIGDDGRCKECGREAGASSADPAPKWRGERGDADAEDHADGDSAAGDPASAGADGDYGDDRQLCSDGACTGLIGSDGKCKVCGLPAAS